MDHDSTYRKFFSHRRMVQDLLTGYVKEDWVADLDFGSLERVETSFVGDQDQRRETDVIWRLKFKGRWLYVYLLLEFQSSNDHWMALRMLVYTGLLYQSLYREGQLEPGKPLPPVLPLVLYNGNRPWRAAQSFSDLQPDMPDQLRHYQPQHHYLLIDENRYTALQMNNIVSAVFALETSPGPDAVQDVLDALACWLDNDDDESTSLKRVLSQWLVHSLFPKRLPDEAIPNVSELSEVKNMLADRVEHWSQRWLEQGMQQGREAGREEGLEEGLQQGMLKGREEGREKGREEGREEGQRLEAARILARLLSKRFQPLTIAQQDRLAALSLEQLEAATEQLFEARSIDDVLG